MNSPELDPDFPIELVGGTTDEARGPTLEWITMHERRFLGSTIPRITCVCRKRVPLQKSFRCRMCGVWFCSTCAVEHFGLYLGKDLNAHRKRWRHRLFRRHRP